nr:hypothetical protein [uncultured bacterium]
MGFAQFDGGAPYKVQGYHPFWAQIKGPFLYPLHPPGFSPIGSFGYPVSLGVTAIIGRNSPANGTYIAADGAAAIYVDTTIVNLASPDARYRTTTGGTVLATAEGSYTIFDGKFYPAQDQIIVIGNDGYLHLWDAETMADIQMNLVPEIDVYPTQVTRQALTNGIYGLALDAGLIDAAAYAETEEYCQRKDQRVSILISQQLSVLDVLQHVISHHNGFITYYDGLIAHRQLKPETPISDINADNHDTLRKPGEFSVQVGCAEPRGAKNRVIVEYTKRNRDYVVGTASDEDGNDIDDYGLQALTVNLPGLTKYSRAVRIASFALRRSLALPESYSFKVGPKNRGVKPGDVYTLTDAATELAQVPVRIASISEGIDYSIDVAATEEKPIYDTLTLIGDEPSTPSQPTPGAPLSAPVRPVIIEMPPHYTQSAELAITWSRSDNPAFAGVSLYRGYDVAGPYNRLTTVTSSGATGVVIAVDTAAETIDVLFDTDATLAPATSLVALLTAPNQNLFAVVSHLGPVWFCRFEDVELITARTYRLSSIIFDVAGTPVTYDVSQVAVGDTVCDGRSIPVRYPLAATDEGRTLYGKLAGVNTSGYEESLANIEPLAIVTNNLVHRPLPVFGVLVNGLPVDTRRI